MALYFSLLPIDGANCFQQILGVEKDKSILNNEFVFLREMGYLTSLLCTVYLKFWGGEKARMSVNNDERFGPREVSFKISFTPAKQ